MRLWRFTAIKKSLEFDVLEHFEPTRGGGGHQVKPSKARLIGSGLSPQATAFIESMHDPNSNASQFYALMLESCEHLIDNKFEQPAFHPDLPWCYRDCGGIGRTVFYHLRGLDDTLPSQG